MTSFGFRPEDYAHEVVHYWPDCRQAVDLFITVGTQWRTGFNGPTGLDYTAIYPLLDRLRLSAEEWDALLTDIRVMEEEALEAMHEKDE
ncbi:DUF1799 domain-containing protein [Variovorax boronicumulans]|uniref:DUF1799 domain-containing protein n=1 Tax=Variovorax boronicumulans TaxID=436515 RepID=UPI001C56AB0B